MAYAFIQGSNCGYKEVGLKQDSSLKSLALGIQEGRYTFVTDLAILFIWVQTTCITSRCNIEWTHLWRHNLTSDIKFWHWASNLTWCIWWLTSRGSNRWGHWGRGPTPPIFWMEEGNSDVIALMTSSLPMDGPTNIFSLLPPWLTYMHLYDFSLVPPKGYKEAPSYHVINCDLGNGHTSWKKSRQLK